LKEKKPKNFDGTNLREIFETTNDKYLKGKSPQEIESTFQKWQESMISTANTEGRAGDFNHGTLKTKGGKKEHHAIQSHVDEQGNLTFTIRSTDKLKRQKGGSEIGKSEETGADLFARMMIYHRGKVKRIKAHWTDFNESLKGNYETFKKAKEANPTLSDAEAAQSTFTGKMAEKFGYNKVTEIKTTKDKNGKEHIEVTFEQ
jgi:hypothetical protein